MKTAKAGVLLPRSSLYPAMAMDVVRGLKAGLAYCNRADDVTLVFENIGFGADSNEIYAKTEKMILQEGVSMVIAFIDTSEAAKLDALCAEMRVLLLVIDPGGHIPTDWAPSAWRYTLSLQAALGSGMAGRLAAEEGGRSAVMATSFYEGGYLQCFAYIRGFERSGGQIHSHVIVPFRHEDFNIQPFSEMYAAGHVEVILALFSAEAGAVFLREFAGLKPEKESRVYASTLMLEETWLAGIDYPFDGIRGYVPWFRGLDNPENGVFVKNMEQVGENKANVFSMAGWEAAQFTVRYLDLIRDYPDKPEGRLVNLENLRLQSPRGVLQMHGATHHLISPMYLVEVVPDSTGRPVLRQIGEVNPLGEDFEQLVEEKVGGVFSKWTNTYLCI